MPHIGVRIGSYDATRPPSWATPKSGLLVFEIGPGLFMKIIARKPGRGRAGLVLLTEELFFDLAISLSNVEIDQRDSQRARRKLAPLPAAEQLRMLTP